MIKRKRQLEQNLPPLEGGAQAADFSKTTNRGLMASERGEKLVVQDQQKIVISAGDEKVDRVRKIYLHAEDEASEEGNLNENNEATTKTLLSQNMKEIKRRCFQVNHLMLSNQPFTVTIYQVVLLVEFLQILFFIFYKVSLGDEFIAIKGHSKIQAPGNSTQGNITTNITAAGVSGNLTAFSTQQLQEEDASNINPLESQLTTLYDYFEFIHPQLQTLRNEDDKAFFFFLVFILASFATLITFLFIFASHLYSEQMAGNVNQSIRYILIAASFAMTLMIKLSEIPFATTFLSGYLCEEDITFNEYALSEILCSDTQHGVMQAISSLGLLFYFSFLFYNQRVFNTSLFTSTVPWAGFDRGVSFVRSCYRFILVGLFVFGKDSSNLVHALVMLACCMLSLFALIRRLTTALNFPNAIQYAEVTYETLTFFLLLVISVHILAAEDSKFNEITVVMLAQVGLLSLVVSALACYLHRIRMEQGAMLGLEVGSNMGDIRVSSIEDQETYLVTLYDIITRNSQEDQLRLEALVVNHVQSCTRYSCLCIKVLAKLDSFKMMGQRLKELRHINLNMGRASNNQDGLAGGIDDVMSGLGGQFTEKSLAGQKSSANSVTDQLQNSTTKVNNNSAVFQQPPILFNSQIIKRQNWEEQSLENLEIYEFENLYDQKQAQKAQFLFLSQLVKNLIDKHPREVSLRLIYMSIIKDSLGNNFKAVFELFNSKLLPATIQQKFELFKVQSDIEQSFQKHLKTEGLKQEKLDVSQVYDNEKLFSKYLYYEYKAVHAAVKFWGALLQKETDSTQINKSGLEVSRAYQKIFDIANQLQHESPNDIKLKFRYALFHLQILNNSHEAMELLKEIQQIYENKTSKKSGDSNASYYTSQQDHQMFGENTAAGLIIFSANSSKIGQILYVNQEIEYLLGYMITDLQGTSLSVLMPYLIRFHYEKLADRLLFKQNFETEKLLDTRIQSFAVNSKGYLVALDILVKVYPQLSKGSLKFMCFLQRQQNFQEMAHLPPQFEGQSQQFIICDDNGFVVNISEGLFKEIGLNSNFFQLRDLVSVNKTFNIMNICPAINYPDVTFSFDCEAGQVLLFDTTNVLQFTDHEQLTPEEMADITKRVGVFQVFTQFKSWSLGEDISCNMHLYRIIVLKKLENNVGESKAGSTYLGSNIKTMERVFNGVSIGYLQSTEEITTSAKNEDAYSLIQRSQSYMSQSEASGSSEAQSANHIIREFKAKINERNVPRILMLYDRFLISIILVIIVLTSVAFNEVTQQVSDLMTELENSLYNEKRYMDMVQLASNARSMINVANDIEFLMFDSRQLQQHGQTRYELLQKEVQSQAEGMKYLHDYISQKRLSTYKSDSEYERIPMYQLEISNEVRKSSTQYRVALYQYLNAIQSLNQTKEKSIWLPDQIIKGVIQINGTKDQMSQEQRTAYFIVANGYRALLSKTKDSLTLQKQLPNDEQATDTLLLLFLLTLSLSALTLICSLYLLHRLSLTKSSLLSLFTMLPAGSLHSSLDLCMSHLHSLDDCSLLTLVRGDSQQQSVEEEKVRKRGNSTVDGSRMGTSHSRHADHGKKMYAQMIKKLYSDIKNYQHMQIANRIQLMNEVANEVSYEAGKIQRDTKQQSLKQPTLDVTRLPDIPAHQDPWKRKESKNRLTRRFQIKVNDQEEEIKEPDLPQKSLKQQKNMVQESDEESNDPYEMMKESRKRQLEKTNVQSPLDKESKKRQIKVQDQRSHRILQVASVFASIMFSGYFLTTQFYHEHFKSEMLYMKGYIPMFFNRYSSLMLSYALLRERIIQNNSFNLLDGGAYLDKYYHDQAIENEKSLQELKITRPALLQEMVTFLEDCDSPRFCGNVIGQNSFNKKASGAAIDVKSLKTNAYQNVIDSVMKSCIAAYYGDIATLKKLKQAGVNLDIGDYDGSAPIYYAIRGNQTAAVKYILQYPVNVNVVDRWGGTALNFVEPGSEIEKLLLGKGAKRGIYPRDIGPPLKFEISTNDYRIFFAAAQGNMRVLKILQHKGWNVNVFDLDGRTPLHLAACSNNLEVTKFLVENGADVMYKDLRLNNALADAIREKFPVIVQYLDNTMAESIIKQTCTTFADGIFNQGVLSAIGTFRKKFEDIQIKVNQTTSYPKMMSLLQGTRFANRTNNYNDQSMKTYYQAQELYLTRIIESLFQKIFQNEFTYANYYIASSRATFAIFIAFQILSLLLLRRLMIILMKKEVFENRGILNLIPAHVFDQNKQEVEKLIKIIVD